MNPLKVFVLLGFLLLPSLASAQESSVKVVMTAVPEPNQSQQDATASTVPLGNDFDLTVTKPNGVEARVVFEWVGAAVNSQWVFTADGGQVLADPYAKAPAKFRTSRTSFVAAVLAGHPEAAKDPKPAARAAFRGWIVRVYQDGRLVEVMASTDAARKDYFEARPGAAIEWSVTHPDVPRPALAFTPLADGRVGYIMRPLSVEDCEFQGWKFETLGTGPLDRRVYRARGYLVTVTKPADADIEMRMTMGGQKYGTDGKVSRTDTFLSGMASEHAEQQHPGSVVISFRVAGMFGIDEVIAAHPELLQNKALGMAHCYQGWAMTFHESKYGVRRMLDLVASSPSYRERHLRQNSDDAAEWNVLHPDQAAPQKDETPSRPEKGGRRKR